MATLDNKIFLTLVKQLKENEIDSSAFSSKVIEEVMGSIPEVPADAGISMGEIAHVARDCAHSSRNPKNWRCV